MSDMKTVPSFSMTKDEQAFIVEVDSEIKQVLLELPRKYKNTAQITHGDRFRPLLVYYGYYLYSKNLNKQVVSVAVAIELIHKASIIVDDIIDSDNKRHERDTVHVQFTTNEAMIIAIFLLGKAMGLLSELNDIIINSLSGMVMKMCRGTLTELSTEYNINVEYVKDIMNDQTSQVIQNSLVMGMKAYDDTINNPVLEVIGAKLGYLFQALNDCEPYFNTDFLCEYKGNGNFDYNKQRKNLCFAYLEQFMTQKERTRILKNDKRYIYKLIEKYGIFSLISEELKTIETDIFDKLDRLKSEGLNVTRLRCFIKYAISIAKGRANIK